MHFGCLAAKVRAGLSNRNMPDTAAILDYWRSIELFSPQNIPVVAPNDRTEPVFAADQTLPLPWEQGHASSRRALPHNTSRRFTVYCGVLATAEVRAILEDTIGKDGESFDERTGGETCLFAFSVTPEGRPLFPTFVMSSCAWATSRTLDPTPSSAEWLSGFEQYESVVAIEFAHHYAVAIDDAPGQELLRQGFCVGRALNYGDLLAHTERVAAQLELLPLIPERGIRIRCGLIASSRKYTADDNDFLNSFYLKDLARVAGEARKGNIGKGLSDLLMAKPRLTERVDVRQSIGTQFQQLSPSLFPRGRWPSKGRHPLVFSQQFAINSMTQQLSGDAAGGIFAVNGPPGTGKTTLLRDLVASVVVERAMRLSELSRPEDAFTGEQRWKVDKYTRVVSVWAEQLQGFEIVITSANNGAVENVTQEIPGIDAVDAEWLDEVDYFRDFATRLLDAPAWAMLGARLGKKSNRTEFTNCLWYGAKQSDLLHSFDVSPQGLLNWLKSVEDQPFDWPNATAEFKAVVAQEQTLRTAREQVHRSIVRFSELAQAIPTADRELLAITAERRAAADRLQLLEDERDELSAKVDEALSIRKQHREFRPGLLEIVFSLGRAFREWRLKDKGLASAHEVAQSLLAARTVKWNAQATIVKTRTADERAAINALQRIHGEQAAVRIVLERARLDLGAAFPDVDHWRAAEDARELSSPWADAKWNDARAKVFIAALALHKEFILACPSTMRKSLQAAMDVLTGAAPSDAPPEAVRAAWTTLFFLVPVVSTVGADLNLTHPADPILTRGWELTA